jgi:hypothetical protein
MACKMLTSTTLARFLGLNGYRFMTSNNRIAPRHILEARILVRLCRDHRNSAVWARNLSESGLGALVAEELEVGERVMLLVPLAPSGDEEIAARVARQVGTQLASSSQLSAKSSARHQDDIRTSTCSASPGHATLT